MRKVAIIGIGQVPVREHWSVSLRELAAHAVLNALDDADIEQVDALYVGNMLSGMLANQEHLGALIAESIGMEGIEALKVEAACGSAAAAFRQAVLGVASGAMDTAVAVGVEKLTELSGISTANGLATAADADYETAMGLSFVAINALLMRRYMYEYKYDRRDFAAFSINAHENAAHNPNALFRHPVSVGQYEKAKLIADPINLLDSSPIGDGAAAVVIMPLDKIDRANSKYISVAACEIATDTIALDNRPDPLYLKGVERSTEKAFKTAGIRHRDVDFFELHDAFSIMAALSLEASGFAEKGSGVRLANNGDLAIKGRLPVATFGGLKGRGHPVGATGIYQIAEAVLQLRREAPEAIRVPEAKCAMIQNIGGSGATVITTILQKRN
jgi:acetyl-CoA C-acetyltransferase